MGRKQKLNKEGIFDIREIYRPPAHIQPEVDIVAVHGLNGSALGTWTTLESGISWLNDPRFLPKYIKNARVLVWGYNASFSSLTGHIPSKNRIHHHAHTLVANLAADRQLSDTADKPIIFLCHSLGGIVVKRALTYAQTRTVPKVTHEHAIFTHTHSILFFGTPHHGTTKAAWLGYLKKLGTATTLGTRSRRSALVSALEHESETLQNTTDFFTPLTRHFRIFYFYEQHPTPFLPIPLLFQGLSSFFSSSGVVGDFIVPPTSAVPAGHDDAERAGIAADHRGMVRFEDPGGQGFRVVVDALVRYCAEAGEVVRLRRLEEAGMLEGLRAREIGEGLMSVGVSSTPGAGGCGSGGGGSDDQLGLMAPDLLLERADSGMEDWMSRTATFRSLSVADEVKDEKW